MKHVGSTDLATLSEDGQNKAFIILREKKNKSVKIHCKKFHMDQEIIYSCLETRNREYYRNVQKESEQIKVEIYIYILTIFLEND